jgi:hypothetical protein
VVLSLSPDQPFCIEYEIEQAGNIKYYLAPKVIDIIIFLLLLFLD